MIAKFFGVLAAFALIGGIAALVWFASGLWHRNRRRSVAALLAAVLVAAFVLAGIFHAADEERAHNETCVVP